MPIVAYVYKSKKCPSWHVQSVKFVYNYNKVLQNYQVHSSIQYKNILSLKMSLDVYYIG